jgi:hypothetical protein
VDHVDASGADIWVSNETGAHVPVEITANTEFVVHGGTTAIGMGPSFFESNGALNGNLVRGFKVHVSCADPLQSPLVAQLVDIETAAYAGSISGPSTTDFTYTRTFDAQHSSDDYTVALNYATAGTDVNGTDVNAFDYWNFAYPTLTDSTISDFVQATSSTIPAVGVSGSVWGDPANMSGWSARNAILLPVPLGLAAVSSTTGLSQDSFGITTVASATSYTVDFSTNGGEATLVYQVDRNSGIVTISPIDITTPSGLSTFENALTMGALVKVYGTPTPTGSLKAYVLLYYTGDIMPAS